ncbi:MAG: Gfo/Idh/MocA family oxidoreductase [Oscillochloris sp.]|nr:Gfo/Idh/MocA family oxidoreductase [Oscillochloris sp.]
MSIRIGIIGTGWGARVQVPAFRAAGLEVGAVAGSDAAKTARIAGELNVGVHTADWRALLRRDDIDLVSIVTPPVLHREMAVAALEAGKHVLCEKPTALDVLEAEVMLAAAQAQPQALALIDHELRFLPALRMARQLIGEGAIGRPRHAEVRMISSGRADPSRPWNWWADATQGGGSLGAIGSHQTDLLRYLLRDEVTTATGAINTFVETRPAADGAQRAVTADDFATAVLCFSQGVVATITASGVTRRNEPNSLTIYGSEGTLRFVEGRLLVAAPDAEFADRTPEHTATFPEGISGDFPQGTVYLGLALKSYFAGDATAITPAATFADGLAVQRVLDSIRGLPTA